MGLPSTTMVSLCPLITLVEGETSGAHKMRILHGLEGYGDSEPPIRNPKENN